MDTLEIRFNPEIRTVSLTDIEDFDAPVSVSMARSLENVGQMVPVLLHGTDAPYKVIDGKRRIAALRSLGDAGVVAILSDAPEDAAAAQATLVANLVRSSNPAAEADAVETLLRSGLDADAIGKQTGLHMRYIKELVAFKIHLHADAFDALKEGRLKLSAAKRMLKLDPQEQAALCQGSGPIRTKDVEAARRAATMDFLDGLEQVTPPTDGFFAPPTPDTLAEQLEGVAGRYAGAQRRLLIDAAALLRNDHALETVAAG